MTFWSTRTVTMMRQDGCQDGCRNHNIHKRCPLGSEPSYFGVLVGAEEKTIFQRID